MRIIIIPDQHGFEKWKKVKPLIDEVDKIIFLGDYFDSWTKGGRAQISNFQQICKFKLRNKEKVELLWGNHETSYYLGERCSGYQHNFAFDIEEQLRMHQHILNVVAIYDEWIFSHAGISKEWLKLCAIDNDPNRINELFKQRSGFFHWVGPDGFGNNPTEGPLWIRPDALRHVAIDGFHQMVGHTECRENVAPLEIKCQNDRRLILIDDAHHNCIVELDTITGDYKLI